MSAQACRGRPSISGNYGGGGGGGEVYSLVCSNGEITTMEANKV
jgi:hypothetical protein